MTDTWEKPEFDHQKSVLLVVTSHTELGNTGQKTGFWFEELATPFWGFYDAGYAVTIASIKGGKATPDPLSTEKEYISESATRFLASKSAMALLDRTLCIDEASGLYPGTALSSGGCPAGGTGRFYSRQTRKPACGG